MQAVADMQPCSMSATGFWRDSTQARKSFMWARMAQVAHRNAPAANGDAGFYNGKIATAQFYMDRLLPQAGALYLGIKSGKASMMALDEAAF